MTMTTFFLGAVGAAAPPPLPSGHGVAAATGGSTAAPAPAGASPNAQFSSMPLPPTSVAPGWMSGL
jgi:hypothetical protein